MTEHEIREIVETQRKFFYTGAVLDVDYRIQALKKVNVKVKFYLLVIKTNGELLLKI